MPMLAIALASSDYWQIFTSLDATSVRAVAANNVGLSLIVCFVSGILTSLTPCVYPMIPITISIFGRAAQRQTAKGFLGFNPYSFRMACVYVAGMCTTYSLMGVIAGMTGSIFGSLLQSAWTLGFLCALFLILSLAQLGLFKVQLPVGLGSRLMGIGSVESKLGIFIMGLISGLVVSPCIGPVIAGILAFVFDTSSAWRGLLYFLSFSLGLGVLFLLIGGFSGLVNRIPRSGAWMTRVNTLLALLLMFVSAYYGFMLSRRVGYGNAPNQSAGLTWSTDEASARATSSANNQWLIIDFTADWCEACHVIDRQVFQNPEVLNQLKTMVCLRVDLTKNSPENEVITRKYGVMGLPTVLFVRPDGRIADERVTGIMTPQEFLGLLSKALLRQ